jgi:hypothetical protein
MVVMSPWLEKRSVLARVGSAVTAKAAATAAAEGATDSHGS